MREKWSKNKYWLLFALAFKYHSQKSKTSPSRVSRVTSSESSKTQLSVSTSSLVSEESAEVATNSDELQLPAIDETMFANFGSDEEDEEECSDLEQNDESLGENPDLYGMEIYE